MARAVDGGLASEEEAVVVLIARVASLLWDRQWQSLPPQAMRADGWLAYSGVPHRGDGVAQGSVSPMLMEEITSKSSPHISPRHRGILGEDSFLAKGNVSLLEAAVHPHPLWYSLGIFLHVLNDATFKGQLPRSLAP